MSAQKQDKRPKAEGKLSLPSHEPAGDSGDLLTRWTTELAELRQRLAEAEQNNLQLRAELSQTEQRLHAALGERHRVEQELLEAQRRAAEAEKLEAVMAERSRELSRSNTELEQFAAVVSHDLRAPLMSIGGCAELLTGQLEGTLDASTAQLLVDIKESVNHMGRLIRSLLAYSRVAKKGLKPAECDAGAVVAAVLRDLHALISAADAQVTVDPLPVVWADKGLLAELFQNLIENAIKYRSDAAPAVHVFARHADGSAIFSISDNGLGIDRQHFERIFQIFQRLHPDESVYPGLGMGLATCKKIVECHGGNIWLESTPGVGSVFHFTLPPP